MFNVVFIVFSWHFNIVTELLNQPMKITLKNFISKMNFKERTHVNEDEA